MSDDVVRNAVEARPWTHGRARTATALLAAAVFLATLGHGFTYDDGSLLAHPAVRTLSPAAAFTAPYHADPDARVPTGLYRPLTVASIAVQRAVHGDHPWLYHAFNVLLHVVVCLLVLEVAFACGLTTVAASAAAFWFAVHPTHAEAVAGIAGRAELLSAAFFLAALLAWARGGARGVAASAVCLTAALLSKETGITFPLVALAWSALLAPRDARGAGRRILGGAAVLLAGIALVLALRMAILGDLFVPSESVTRIENPLVGLEGGARWATSLSLVGRYALLLAFPIRLSPDWGWATVTPVTSALDPWLWLGIAVLAGGACLLGAARRLPVAAFAVVLAGATYLVISNAFVLIGVGMAERLLYLPSAGMALLVGWGWGAMEERFGGRPHRAVGLAVLGLLALRCILAADAWKDDFTLFSAAERATPNSVKALGNLAVELVQRGRLPEARERLSRAARLAPEHVPTRINLAGVLLKLGELDAAEQEVRAALEAEPDMPVAWAQLGALARARGNPDEAVAALRRAVTLEPRFVAARIDLADSLAKRGEIEAARTELDEVLTLAPDSIVALRTLAGIEAREGRRVEAERHLRQAAALAPDDPSIRAEIEALSGGSP